MYTTLTHHGILGQKWGVRRYQNKDGTLTSAGKKHVATLQDAANKASKFAKYAKEDRRNFEDTNDEFTEGNKRIADQQIKRYTELAKKYTDMSKNINDFSKEQLREAKKFLNSTFESADYTWYYDKGTWRNYQES